MNLDLIIKLVKLANNNPNENESNLAARKVCKLIAEGNYKFNMDASIPSNPTFNYRPTQAQNDFFDTEFKRQYYWGPPEPPRYTRPPKPESKPEPKKYNPLEKKTIRCTKCGNLILTGFVGPPQVFVCTACQWKGI